ncbi:DNA-protecting protein DprA [candidate division WWE3 bacterium]|nr:DNA-protecting protein DprA [candidate division WWE3 bacterium]
MDVISLNSKKYPSLLGEIRDPPEKLYIRGEYNPAIFKACLAVVGSRKMTPYGKRVTQKFVYDLAARGITIVSGFMYGVDAEAHRAALSAGGRTIAVMACGINRVCPGFQKELHREILDSGGLVVSEYPGDTHAQKWTFPKRNRIVAGLSQAVFVVEAGKGSGTLITAGYAKKNKRQVFVAPGNVFSDNFQGICQLLREGARAVGSPFDIRVFYEKRGEEAGGKVGLDTGVCLPENKSGASANLFDSLPNLDPLEKQILSCLKANAQTADELNQALVAAGKQVSISSLNSSLTSLVLRGLIKEEGDRYYVS